MRYTVDTIAGLAFGAEVNTLESDGDVIQQHLDKIFPALVQAHALAAADLALRAQRRPTASWSARGRGEQGGRRLHRPGARAPGRPTRAARAPATTCSRR